MAIIKSFKGFRPVKEKANELASRPYDVLNSKEARKEVEGNPYSFLHVVKPEIDLDENVNLYSEEVYNKAKTNLQKLIADGVMKQDKGDYLYIYAQTMNGKTQYGLVAAAAVEDYLNDIIKKHELTRPDKEADRMNHVRTTNFNAEPVFFAYPQNNKIDEIVSKTVKTKKAEYDFTTEDNVGHHFWVIDDKNDVESVIKIFKDEIPYTYVADGHHRTAAAALVGAEKKENNKNHNGQEEYNFFLAVHFPDNQLNIIDYNRVVKDLNGLSKDEFINKLNENFTIEEKGEKEYKPNKLHNFSMYLENKWYSLTAKENTYNDNDPIESLDVTVLTNSILAPMLDIKDLRTSKRIDFVGGIRGIGELKRRVDNGEMKVAFALYPVSMKQLINIADTGNIMPPKTTWFEPKLRSGLILHSLD